MVFQYGEKEIDYLKAKDVRLAKVIDEIGHIEREVDTDLFSSVVHQILGQQISTKALQTIWKRITDALTDVTPKTVDGISLEEMRAFGISLRKAAYLKDFAQKVLHGDFDLNAVEKMPDNEAIAALSSLKGIGVWTAEMVLLFGLKRPNILSYDDLGIRRGMMMVYHHRKMDRKLFEKYRKRLSPYCSVASLYFWEQAQTPGA